MVNIINNVTEMHKNNDKARKETAWLRSSDYSG